MLETLELVHFRTVLTASCNVKICVFMYFLSMDTCDLRDHGLVSGWDALCEL